MSADSFGCRNWGVMVYATGINCVKARDAAKHSPVHRMAPYNKELLPQNVNSARVEKLCSSSCVNI